MMVICVQAKVGNCNIKCTSGIPKENGPHDMNEYLTLSNVAICPDSKLLVFYVNSSFSKKYCRQLLVETTLRKKFIGK